MSENKLNILNGVFSRNTFRHCIESGYDKTYAAVVRRYFPVVGNKSNIELIREIYKQLKSNYRNEYFYKNTLLNKLLLGIHSVNTTTALTELSIAKSKADFILINGKAVVYEIKTELDNFDRLEGQICDYYKAFDHVAVVTCEENLQILKKRVEVLGMPVGIFVLQKKGTLSLIKKPEEYRENLDTETIFKLLRKNEYEEILLKYYCTLPKVSAFKYYTECKKLFQKIPMELLYADLLYQLKKRVRIEKEAFDKVPYELKFLVYFMNLKLKDYKKLSEFLEQSYGGV